MPHTFDQTVMDKQTAAKAEIKLSALANKTYAQVQAYVDSQVTDLASAKTVLKKLAVVSLALLKERDLSS